MLIFCLINFFSFVCFMYLGFYSIRLGYRYPLNRLFFLLSLSLATWAFTFTFFHWSLSYPDARFWYRLSSFGWCLFSAFALHCILILTNRKDILGKKFIYIPIYAPGAYLIYKAFTSNFAATGFVYVNFGWNEILPLDSFPVWFFYFYQTGYIFICIILLLQWRSKANTRKQKKQVDLINLTIIIPLVFCLFFDIILPSLSIFIVPALSPIFLLFFAFGIWHAINKYKLLSLEFSIAADTIIATIKDILILVDPLWKIKKVNNQFIKLTEFGEDEILDKDLSLIFKEKTLIEEKIHLSHKNESKGFQTTCNLLTKTNVKLPVNIRVNRLWDEYQDNIGSVIICNDLREKIQLKEEIEKQEETAMALSESEEKYRTILENIAEGYYEVDLNGNFTFFNKSLCNILGLTKEELMGLSYKELSDEKTTRAAAETYKKAYIEDIPVSEFGGTVTFKGGKKRFYQTSISLRKDSQGVKTGFHGLVRDITEKKEFEEALKKRNAQMEKDLVTAQLIQRSLIKITAPEVPEVTIECKYLPMDLVGGDYFSFTPLTEGGVGFFIGDVASHGVTAALFLSLIKATTDRICRQYPHDPKEYIKILNDELYGNMPMSFITAIYGYFKYNNENNDNSVDFTYANGGHPYPIVHNKSDDSVKSIKIKGTLIGHYPEVDNEIITLNLKKGDRVFIYTDGIIEVINEKNEMFELKDLKKVIKKTSGLPLKNAMDSIISEVTSFKGNSQFSDDIVLIGFEIQ